MEVEEEVVEVSMEYLLEQVLHKDLGKRLQVGQEIIELILDQEKSPELEQDQTGLDRMVDAVASSWVNSSNFKVSRDGGRKGGGGGEHSTSVEFKLIGGIWWVVFMQIHGCSWLINKVDV